MRRERVRLAALRMDEGDVVTGGPLSDPAGCESHATAREVLDRHVELVDPDANVIERWHVHLGGALRIDRLHDVELDGPGLDAEAEDVLVHVLLLTAIPAHFRHAEHVLPEVAERTLVERTNGDLLQPEHTKRAHCRTAVRSAAARETGTRAYRSGATERSEHFCDVIIWSAHRERE